MVNVRPNTKNTLNAWAEIYEELNKITLKLYHISYDDLLFDPMADYFVI